MYRTKSTELKHRYETRSNSCSNCGAHVTSDSFFCQVCGSEVTLPSKELNSRLETFKGYIQVIGIVEIVFGIITLFGALLVTVVVPLVFYGLRYANDVPPYLLRFVIVLIFGIALLLYIFAFACIISGRKLLQYKNSGRIGTMIIGALNLFNVPIGTIFGIAALYVLSQPDVIDLYTKS